MKFGDSQETQNNVQMNAAELKISWLLVPNMAKAFKTLDPPKCN